MKRFSILLFPLVFISVAGFAESGTTVFCPTTIECIDNRCATPPATSYSRPPKKTINGTYTFSKALYNFAQSYCVYEKDNTAGPTVRFYKWVFDIAYTPNEWKETSVTYNYSCGSTSWASYNPSLCPFHEH